MGPNAAVAEVRRAVRTALAASSGPVLVACSGGADSLALAAATAFEAPRHDLRAGLVTVDHGLQPGSAAQAARVAAIGYELGFDPVITLRVSVGIDGGREAAARTARYAALDATATALSSCVLLGHTLDDQAETVLLGLGRGSGPRSIAGMRAEDRHYLRPLLGVRRATTVAACAALGLEPWHDPHNEDPTFQRVRLRREVLPLLEDVLQGGVAEALARTAALVRDDLEALDEISPADVGEALDVASLVAKPRALRMRALRAWARHHGVVGISAVHLGALDGLLIDWHGQGPVDLPGGRALRASGKLAMNPSPSDVQE
jgi:tRNA(Ile)-lysidine synthase